MRPRKPYELGSALKRKGFRPKEADHTWYELYVDEKRTDIRTKISHTRKEYDQHLLGKMAGQLHLRIDEFELLIKCPISAEDYVSMLRAKQRL